MLKRKIADLIEEHMRSGSERILLIDGTRQAGKTYIARHVRKKLFPDFIGINILEDPIGDRLFENAKTIDDFDLRVSSVKGWPLNCEQRSRHNEIQRFCGQSRPGYAIHDR